MAHSISNASLDNIYERMNDAPEYHPLDAETFADWTLEAGDIVSVVRDGESYDSPVHTAKMVWKGAPQITLSSTGNKEREAVSKISRKKYGSGGAAVRANEGIHSYVWNTESTIYSYVDQTATYIVQGVEDVANSLGSEILQTASQIRSEVHAADSQLYSYVDQTATYINSVIEDTANSLGSAIYQTASQIRSEVHASNSELYSYVDQTATYIRSEVNATESGLYSYVDQTASGIRQVVANTANGLQSNIDQEAGRISLVVEGTGSNAHIRAAQIAQSINTQTGTSIVKISADKVDIDGNTIVEYLEGTAVGVQSIMADEIILNGGGQLLFYQDSEIGSSEAANLVVDAYVDNGILHLVHYNGDETTFEKAASIESLAGSWSGSTLTVSTDPDTGKTYTVGLNPSSLSSSENLSVLSNGTPTISPSNEKYVDAPMKVVSVSAGTPPTTTTRYEFVMPVNATSAWNAGNAAGQSAGAADVKLFPEWDVNVPNKLTVSKTTGPNYDTSYTLYVVAGLDDLTYNSTTHKYSTTAHAKAGTSAAGATDRSTESKSSGTEAYDAGYSTGNYAGKASVTLNDPTWNAISGSIPSNRTVTVSTSGRTNSSGTTENLSKSVALYLTQGSWSNNNLTVSMRTTSTSGTEVAKTVVSAPTPTVNTWSLNYQSSPYAYTASVKVNGTTYTSSTLSATNAYDNGWSGCYGTVGLDSTTATTLSYGQSVTVYAQAKAASGSPSKTNVASRKITAPSMATPQDWQLSYQSSPYTYHLKVKLNGSWYESGNYSATNAYDNGWSGAYATVGLNGSGTTILDYGTSVTVYAQAKATSGAQSKTNVASWTISSHADRYDTGYEDGWKAGWTAYYNDGSDWIKDWAESGTTKSVWIPKMQGNSTTSTTFNYWSSAYGRGKGNGSGSTCLKWFEYTTGGGSSCNHHKVSGTKFKCTVSGTGTGRYYTLTANITSTQYLVNGGEYILYV